ncbi:hypothetical protein GGQ22_04895 [Nocardioides sp. zg-579]|uniref:Uncharacterized protein n=1 Tax=Nocardioides marmotae TaxID=2663857 RepID=A0A6I3J5C6_9ACTN|nr:hypothetical protein [Nocardioides marmotae]MCR6030780.1 hypothetical protein [Gordonia jinghuaiqii]MTB94414.1 hypothetical protein [Nocardioides marmotae]QKE01563.1 hypothetical protein HPC71_11100 [Nocardioides marmotae]
MRTPLVLAAATALAGLGLSPSTANAANAAAEPTVTHERGVVVECGGRFRGDDVYVSVYENNTFANVFQVVVGDEGLGRSRESANGFVSRGEVRAGLRLDDRRVLVAGTAKRVGKRIAVHEEHDDAGQHIVIDGFHRALRTDLAMTWKGRTIGLDCGEAFFYDLEVTTTDTTGD